MKKFFMMAVAALLTFGFTACSTSELDEQVSVPTPKEMKLNISVADLNLGNPETRAVKTGWVAGDKINIWYDENDQHEPDLVIVYDGEKWDKDTSVTLSGNEPSESGKLKFVYEGFNDLSSYKKYVEVGIHLFSSNAPQGYGISDTFSNLILTSVKNNPESYTYSAETLSFSINNWSIVTDVQVVVTGIEPRAYLLKCDKLGLYLGFGLNGSMVMLPAPSDNTYSSLGFSNDGGTAYYFTIKNDIADADFTFTLRERATGKEYVYTAEKKSLTKGKLNAIKLDFKDFKAQPNTNGHGYVDLGLSVYWADMNIGAQVPGNKGAYFAWGEKSTKEKYDFYTYPMYNSESDSFSKYTLADGPFVLDSEDDTASSIWKGGWRMPTAAEMQELIDVCEWNEDNQDGANGFRVTAPNGKSIFLPYGGGQFNNGPALTDNYGYYWSSSLSNNNNYNSSYLNFSNYNVMVDIMSRSSGFLIRPVIDK